MISPFIEARCGVTGAAALALIGAGFVTAVKPRGLDDMTGAAVKARRLEETTGATAKPRGLEMTGAAAKPRGL